MKIIFTPTRFFPYMGGVEHSTYHLAKALVALGCEAKVICADEGPGKKHETIDAIEVERLPYICKVANTNITLGLSRKLWREPCDIIHTFMPTPWAADWSILIGKLRRKKTVISIKNDMHHDGSLANILDKIYVNTVFRVSISLVDKIFMVNPGWEESFVNTRKIFKRHVHKMVIVPNGINLDTFTSRRVKRRKNEILFVSILSSFHKYKGLDNLLTAIKELVKIMPEVHLTIVGDGELKPFYERLVDELQLRQYVTFVGQVDQKRLAHFYAQSSVFVLPSNGVEGFGNVVLESLACKTPVVVTTIVGMADDIKQFKCGKVVAPNNPKQLAGAFNDILSDEELWHMMSENGLKMVRAKYEWSTVAQQVKDEYGALLSV